jgi:hypothetical protein
MLVKCWDLNGEKRPKELCYKAPNRKYYSCKSAYEKVQERTKWKNKCTAFMQEIMGYEQDMKLPTSWYKFVEEFSSYGFDVIYDTLVVNEKTFRWALETKTFKNDSHALNYFKAIIQNSIMEQFRQKKARKKADIKEQSSPCIEMLEISAAKELGQTAVKGKNLSGLVGNFI